jgi:hypothetical protein
MRLMAVLLRNQPPFPQLPRCRSDLVTASDSIPIAAKLHFQRWIGIMSPDLSEIAETPHGASIEDAALFIFSLFADRIEKAKRRRTK